MKFMCKYLRAFGIATLLLLTGLDALAQRPSNDLFQNAIQLIGPIVTTTGNNVGANKNFSGEPLLIAGDFGGASVWWTWMATASGPTTIDTEGSDFDTLLGVFTGSVANQLVLVADNNNFGGNLWSKAQFNAVAGTVYRIVVDGVRIGGGQGGRASQGNITLNVKGVGGITFNSPTNGMVFTVGDAIPVAVTIDADFPNPPATRVDFYVGGNLFASRTAAPFSAVATDVPAGSNAVYVIAYDNAGAPIQSPVVTVFVQSIGVTLLTPFEDTVFQDTRPITVTAWTYLPSGLITNMEFFVDGAKFGDDDAPPFSGTWSNVVGGSHRFTAIGRSETGARYTSQAVNIGVATSIVASNSVWKYLDDGSDQGVLWVASDFNDASWASGPAPFGYGDSNGRAPLTTNSFGPSSTAKHITTYYRQAFEVTGPAGFSNLLLKLQRDDGAVVYLNGLEVGRFNMPTGQVTSATFAVNANDDGGTTFTAPLPPNLFSEGRNVFAVEIHQDSGSSSDIWFVLELLGVPIIIHNLSPVIELTQPASNSFYLAPSEVLLAATASDADGSVAKVEFFADGIKIGETNAPPYQAVWSNPSVAAHILTAVATDEQGATTTSEEIAVVIYDAVGTPVAAITAPPDGHVVEGPTNMLVTATAHAITGVTNVQFLANGVPFSNDDVAPYSASWPAPFGTNILTAVSLDANGVSGVSPPITVVITIPPTNVINPTIARQTPTAAATVTNLTGIVVIFSERVQNVNASDLLINGVAATNVTGNGTLSNYTFTFPQPAYGPVDITWVADHGILDYGYPANLPFDSNAAGATWSYNLIDRTPPTILAKTPAAGSTVTNLGQISVLFSEPVTGVDATDFLVNGAPAQSMTGGGANYTFNVAQPSPGAVNISWTTTNNITDLSDVTNAFNRTGAGAAWTFTLDTRVTLIQSNSNWRFVKGLAEASTPTDAWRQRGFEDSSWSNSPAPFFFGDPYTNASIRGTLLSDMNSNYTTIFLRQEFNVESRGTITNLLLNHQSDDGFVAWLNGVEVLRFNVPAGNLPYNTNASNAANEPSQAGAAYIVATLTNNAVSRLVNGTNVLAILALNQSLNNSSDFGFNAHLYYFPIDATTVPPRLVSAEPSPGDIFYLTNVTINFSESVSGVDAGDLLVNGVAASAMSTTTNSIYTFSFPQPAYGPVLVTWTTNHGIADFDNPPKAFDGASPSARVSYVLLNPSSPRIATQTPASGTIMTGLTSIVVTFTEPVAGLEASDLLISGVSASAVITADNITHTFSFVQPPFGNVAVRWATNHGITDVEVPSAPFDPTRFGGQWNYTLINPVPSIALTSPTNNTYFLPPANITLRATATDNDGTVTLVEFYEGNNKLGQGTSAPYALSVSNLLLGTYVFRAVATDNIGLMATSSPVVLNVVTSLPITLVRGPYLQSGSPTGGVVRWRTDAISDGVVYYGTDLANLTNAALQSSVTNDHIVQLAGLEPNTKYYYSIGSSGFRLVGGSNDGANYWFETSPPVGANHPTRLWILGDAGTAGNGSPDRQASTRDAFYNFAATNGPTDLVLMLGDNAYNSGTDAEHQRAIFDMYPTTLRNKFLWPTLGNHETSQSATTTDFPYLHIFSLPRNGEAGGLPSGTEKYYSFDYGNIHFVCLDSMTSGRTGTTPMARWLEDDLNATAQEWIIVFFHHPPYTKGSHDSDREGDLVEIRQNLVPILEAHGVDLVLNGHSHCYERSYLLDGHYGMSTTLTESMKLNGGDGREEGTGAYRKNAEGRGVIYNVAGSSGQATGGPLNLPAYFISLNELGSVVIDVNSNRLDALFLNAAGVTRDRYTLLKPDLRPAAPLNLVALPTSATEVGLAWTPGSTNQLGYSVERSLDGVNFTEHLTAPVDAVTTMDASLLVNTTYYYRVRATNFFGVSEPSNIASVRTVLPTSVPLAPAALSVSADNGGGEFYRSQLILNWRDRSTNEAAFQIERSLDGSSYVVAATVGANVTHYVDRGLPSGSPSYYRIRAVNQLGASAPCIPAGEVTHPQSQFALAGLSATFHAGIEGAPLVKYQWQFRGVPLAGQTNEVLIFTNVHATNEGDYTVVIRDTADRFVEISNPAYLFVLMPPRIVAQPQDRLNFVGTPAELSVLAEGTGPLSYTWRKNGTPMSQPLLPTLSFSSVQLGDGAGYDVVVANDFSSVTSRVARLDVFEPVTIAAVPDAHAEVLRRLVISNSATDPNATPFRLTYSLATGAPTNAAINPTNGTFSWTPTRKQAPSTNLITVRITDPGYPLFSSSMSFNVLVNDYVEVMAGRAIMAAGETNSVPVDVFSSAELIEVQCALRFPWERLTNFTIEALIPELASASLQMSDAATVALTFTAAAGRTLQGTQQLARLHFEAVPGQISAFVPLQFIASESTRASAGLEPTMLVKDGRAVVVGAQPLLEQISSGPSSRNMMLYGKRGTTYTVESSTNLNDSAAWRARGTLPGSTMTNLFRSLPLSASPPPPVFYRIRQ